MCKIYVIIGDNNPKFYRKFVLSRTYNYPVCELLTKIPCVNSRVAMGMLHHHHQQHQFQKVVIAKHQSVFEARQMQSFRTNTTATGEQEHGENNGDNGEEHPPPLPYKKRHSKSLHVFQDCIYSR